MMMYTHTTKQEPMKTKAPQLHMEYRFYRILGSHGKSLVTVKSALINTAAVGRSEKIS